MGGVVALVVAAGRGHRAGGTLPKQYRRIGRETVLRRTLKLFCDHPSVGSVQAVIHPDDAELYAESARGLRLLLPVAGGASRQDSVRLGLAALRPENPDVVLVHDAARPFASAALLDRAIEAARMHGAAIPVMALTDTVKSVDARDRVTGTLDRDTLRIAQTPQAFGFAALDAAHARAHEAGQSTFSDDAALAEWAGLPVGVFPGEANNMKLTTDADFQRIASSERGDIRTGSGYDVHAFGAGDHVTLGGVKIAHDQGLSGHSDADVAMHAVVDAILGAIADGDIGSHFPPSDPQWRGKASAHFLTYAAERVRARGGTIVNLDVSLLCEAPKIGPHRDAMRAAIADAAGISSGRVGVKATTSEGLGFIGRREGIAAYATATIRLPESGDD